MQDKTKKLLLPLLFMVAVCVGFCSCGDKKKNSTSGESEDKAVSTCPDSNHPHAIDLGLPSGTKWACCNVDASSPVDYGGYYAWGETKEKSKYNKSTYKYYDSSTGSVDIGHNIAGTSYDVAHVKWGGSWCMPSLEQTQELLDKCSGVRVQQNGVSGRLFTGPNGNSVFFPAGGFRYNDVLHVDGSYGVYWLSTLNGYSQSSAYYFYFNSGFAYWNCYHRYYGHMVRPVRRN